MWALRRAVVPGEVLGVSVLHTHLCSGVWCFLLPVVGTSHQTRWGCTVTLRQRQLQRKNGVWKYTNASSLLNLFPEKEVEKVFTLFPSHSKLSIQIPSCFQTPSLLCASGAVRGRQEQGLQDRDKTSTARLTWKVRGWPAMKTRAWARSRFGQGSPQPLQAFLIMSSLCNPNPTDWSRFLVCSSQKQQEPQQGLSGIIKFLMLPLYPSHTSLTLAVTLEEELYEAS